jgi:hypothetical protein
MKLDYKWLNYFESILHFWTAKDQDLEAIVAKLVDDDTWSIWLTHTLSFQPNMDAAICQTITTELTFNGTHGSMVLSNATLLDSTRSKQTRRRQETNQANINSNTNCVNNSCNCMNASTPTPVVK